RHLGPVADLGALLRGRGLSLYFAGTYGSASFFSASAAKFEVKITRPGWGGGADAAVGHLAVNPGSQYRGAHRLVAVPVAPWPR
ncbi:MAG TPA: hypothetical protein VEX18_02790, partial [Polyangiaceae bacterium]|nr:hypothetical protein [Polyangiaceae bacterium]